jgi:hypothetical protein
MKAFNKVYGLSTPTAQVKHAFNATLQFDEKSQFSLKLVVRYILFSYDVYIPIL